MIHFPAKTIETEEGQSIVADGEIPAGWKVRGIDGEFQAIPPDEEWAE